MLLTLLVSLLKARHYQTPGFSSASAEHGQFSGSQAVHESYGVAQAQHPSTYAPGPSVPVSFASSSQIRGKKTKTKHIYLRPCPHLYQYIYIFFFLQTAFPMQFCLSSTHKQIFRSLKPKFLENFFGKALEKNTALLFDFFSGFFLACSFCLMTSLLCLTLFPKAIADKWQT